VRSILTAALSVAALLSVSFTTAGAQQPPEDDRTKDPAVLYRELVMRGVGANAAAIGLIMQKKVPQDENLAMHAEAIALGAHEALKAFEPKVQGGTSKPDIWDNWQDFADRLKALETSATEVADLAKQGGVAAAQPKILDMLSCKSCHDKYRTK
jgi:cytochrome c556